MLPEKFIISGHSEGGSMALGTAGFIAYNAKEDGMLLDLVGVLLFDSGPAYRASPWPTRLNCPMTYPC